MRNKVVFFSAADALHVIIYKIQVQYFPMETKQLVCVQINPGWLVRCFPMGTGRNNNVIITSKRRRGVVLTS